MEANYASWIMAVSIAAVCGVILALIYLPGFQPTRETLACDAEGGYWSEADDACVKSDSPAAGMAS